MTGTPFFVTAATAQAAPQATATPNKTAGVKRRAPPDGADATPAKCDGVELLRSQFEQLEATKKNQLIPLGVRC
jgi:hypothetical protein